MENIATGVLFFGTIILFLFLPFAIKTHERAVANAQKKENELINHNS